MNPITVFQLASWTIGLWDYWLVGIEAGAGPILIYKEMRGFRYPYGVMCEIVRCRGLARAGCGELTFLPANHKAAVLANTALNLFGSQEP